MKILITGGNGFIGEFLCKKAKELNFEKIISLSRSEYNTNSFVEVELGDIIDKKRINKIFLKHKPDVVIHAAAYKHINLMEQNPQDAIQNNIIGTVNIFNSCIECGVKTCIFISTDKASNPSSVYGLTKLVGEELVKTYSKFNKTKFITARFCNIYGSSGSVVQIFEECIKNNEPLKITDFNMRRYFISPEEASNFIFELIDIGKSGNIYMYYVEKDINIKELAEKMLHNANINLLIIEIGLRPGEKLSENYNIINAI